MTTFGRCLSIVNFFGFAERSILFPIVRQPVVLRVAAFAIEAEVFSAGRRFVCFEWEVPQ